MQAEGRHASAARHLVARGACGVDQHRGERIAYGHIAGHFEEAEDLRVDTHGADVIDPVWQLLDAAYAQFGVFPTLLERDFNIPPVDELLMEVDQIRGYQRKYDKIEQGDPQSLRKPTQLEKV